MNKEYRVCTRCVSDTTLSGIRFDEQGVCNYCWVHDELERIYPIGPEGQRRLARIVEKIRRAGRNKPYDCIVGVSGGRDSTYCLYMAVKLGLRPLAVHFDNGWDGEIAVRNIKNACGKLGVDLYTHVADWDEFRDLQIAFLRASVPEAEIPTDVAIHGTLCQAAVREGIRYILLGHSFRTEGIAPIEWTYMDGRYIRAVRKRFGIKRQKTVPNFTAGEYIYYSLVKRIHVVPILNYLPYVHKDVMGMLEEKLEWRYYGGHHQESSYTHFCQTVLFVTKFNIDKRLLEYSALIRSGHMEREEALKALSQTSPTPDPELVGYCIRKLGLTMDEWKGILADRPKSFRDYPTYYGLMQALRGPLTLAHRLGLISPILYFKYLG